MRGGDVAVDYEIATDAAMHDIVRRGEATAERAFAYSVHLDVGGLSPAGRIGIASRAATRRAPSAAP